jgi:hypothetical protein
MNLTIENDASSIKKIMNLFVIRFRPKTPSAASLSLALGERECEARE